MHPKKARLLASNTPIGAARPGCGCDHFDSAPQKSPASSRNSIATHLSTRRRVDLRAQVNRLTSQTCPVNSNPRRPMFVVHQRAGSSSRSGHRLRLGRCRVPAAWRSSATGRILDIGDMPTRLVQCVFACCLNPNLTTPAQRYVDAVADARCRASSSGSGGCLASDPVSPPHCPRP